MAQTQREADSGLELALMGPTSGRLPSHLGLVYRELGFQFILYWENYVNVIQQWILSAHQTAIVPERGW